MYKDLTKEELDFRRKKFYESMNEAHPEWDTAIIISKINQYYFTGTMQDGMLVLKKNGEVFYFVLRSFERAKDESPLPCIYEMKSYRDAAGLAGEILGNTYVETDTVTLSIAERLKKYFRMDAIHSLDHEILSLRAVKTPYELKWMIQAGKKHHDFMQNVVPSLFCAGISEADFAASLYEKMVRHGHQGTNLFHMFEADIFIGMVSFGESALYPTSFNGPGGAYGMCAAVPHIGSRERKLKKGDLVYIDLTYGVNGYYTDKTQVYSFGAKPAPEVLKAHRACMDIETKAASLLKPGAQPSDIYQSIMNDLPDSFKENFMGFGNRKVQFLGHGVGLNVDEYPVIAAGKNTPLIENMVIALEPKKGIPQTGMVGVEDTYIVASDGGLCITGGGKNIMVV